MTLFIFLMLTRMWVVEPLALLWMGISAWASFCFGINRNGELEIDV